MTPAASVQGNALERRASDTRREGELVRTGECGNGDHSVICVMWLFAIGSVDTEGF